jgi:ribosome-associated heat shock protein Hsp15
VVRIDKWLWAVRLYKTRTTAAVACRAGHVKISGQNAKPSHPVRFGEIISAEINGITRVVRVLGLLHQRVGAKLVAQYLDDMTPASEYEKARENANWSRLAREPGTGRPTKRERRALQKFLAPPLDLL